MAVHAHAKRLDPLNELESVERAHARTEVPQSFDPAANDEGYRPEDLAEFQAVIGGRWLVDLGMAAPGPVELTRINDDAADRSSMSAHELGQRVHHDVGAVVDRPANVRRRESVVNYQRNIGVVCNLCDGF